MNKTMSKFLETRVFGETIRIRTVLTLLLCVVNFALAYGICLYYLMSGGPTLLIISLNLLGDGIRDALDPTLRGAK